MIVVDAGAWAMSFLDGTDVGDRCREVLDRDRTWATPAHAPLEVLRTISRFERAGHLTRAAADVQVARVVAHRVRYTTVQPDALAWVWERRHNLSFYDAPYVHLASRLAVPLVTLDGRLARAAEEIGVQSIVPGESS